MNPLLSFRFQNNGRPYRPRSHGGLRVLVLEGTARQRWDTPPGEDLVYTLPP